MMYLSQAQRRYFNANRTQLEQEGVNVEELNKASKGRKLPEHHHKKKPRIRDFLEGREPRRH